MNDKELMKKLDGMLAGCIADVKGLGIDLYDIKPNVRLTNNTRTLGTAQDMNKAFYRAGGVKKLRAGAKPLFRISIARSECNNDYDIKNVLYHEVLHCAPNCQNHGKQWKAYAAKVNAKFGTNVTTTKKVDERVDNKTYSQSDLAKLVGKSYKVDGKVFRFTGFNSRPKKCCDIVEEGSGRKYVCEPDYLGKMLEEHPCLFASNIEAPIPPLPNPDIKSASKLLGKKVKNGPRGRKVFTVESIEPTAGKRAVCLIDERGAQYFGGMGVIDKLVVVS